MFDVESFILTWGLFVFQYLNFYAFLKPFHKKKKLVIYTDYGSLNYRSTFRPSPQRNPAQLAPEIFTYQSITRWTRRPIHQEPRTFYGSDSIPRGKSQTLYNVCQIELTSFFSTLFGERDYRQIGRQFPCFDLPPTGERMCQQPSLVPDFTFLNKENVVKFVTKDASIIMHLLLASFNLIKGVKKQKQSSQLYGFCCIKYCS